MMDGSTSPTPQPAVARFPTSTAQRQMWFVDQMSPGDPTLHIAVRWEVRGTVRAASLEAGFQGAIDRHEILRTRFVEEGGEPMQEVVDHVPFRLGTVDLRTTPAAQHAARLDEIAREDAARPFDLTRPGLIRATLVRLSAERAVLLIAVHHIVFDGYSIGVLGQEVGQLAAAAEAGEILELPELPLQYGDFTLWQRDYLASGVQAEDEAYWLTQMRDAPYFELAADKPRPAIRPTSVARTGRDIDRALIERLEAVAKDHDISVYTLGAAAVSAALHRITGAAEVLMVTPIAGRTDSDLEPLIGSFVNNQILRLPVDPAAGFDGHLATTRRVVEEALAHQSLPFHRLVEILNPPRDAARAPLASVAFTLQHVFHRDARYGTFELLSEASHMPGSAQDFNILLVGRPSGWRLTVDYCPDLFEAATADALAETMAAAFAAVANGMEDLSDLPVAPGLAGRDGGSPRPFARLEDVLAGHPEVDAAAAVPAGATGGAYAFVSPRGDSFVPLETLPAELMGFAARRLAPEECPRGISVLAALPRLASGDLDRARLPQPLLGAAPAPFVPVPAPQPQPRPQPAAPAAAQAPAAPAPAEDVESVLAGFWSELLDRAEVPRDTGFFELGGHSLLAVRLMSRIRERWGLRLGVATLYHSPTLAGLAALVSAEVAPQPSPSPSPAPAPAPAPAVAVAAEAAAANSSPADDWRIEPIMTEGDAQPIIAINDVGLILDTAQHLADAHPTTCVRLFDGTRGLDRTPRSFEEIAAEYAATIRAAQPEGPYLLFGVCVHGNIALEAARILQAEGAEITGVVIKDVWEPGYSAALKTRRTTRWAERLFALRNRVRMVRMGTMSLATLLGSYRLLRRLGVPQAARALGLIERVQASDLAPEQERFVAYISAARNRYRPAAVAFPVLHVVTRITAQGRHFLPSIGWEKIVNPACLKTVHLDEVVVARGHRIGTAELAREIDGWLSAPGAKTR